jgi:hypothetical protein
MESLCFGWQKVVLMDHTSNAKTAVRHTVLSVVVIPEKAASPEEVFAAAVLEEIVYLEAAVAWWPWWRWCPPKSPPRW